MNKLLLLTALSASAVCAEPTQVRAAAGDKPSPRVAEKIAAEGGLVLNPKSAVGKVVFIDTQDVLDKSVIIDTVRNFDRNLIRYDFNCVKEAPGRPLDLKRRTGATLAVIIAYDDETPSLLVSPDEGWSAVNLKRLTDDLKSEEAKRKFFVSRSVRQILRGFSAACGGLRSSFKGNVMSIAKLGDLDLCRDALPVDKIQAARDCFHALGMKPRKFTYYSTACEEGWAPAPTNDVQKAIWERVHRLPTKPITIEPEKK